MQTTVPGAVWASDGRSTGGEGALVLVADDEPAVRRLVAAILRGRGYRVLEAESGDAALAQATEELALLVADLVMPPDGGVELADQLRRRVPGLKVLFISGYGVLGQAANPADPLLSKPFDPPELIRRVEDLLATVRAEGPAA